MDQGGINGELGSVPAPPPVAWAPAVPAATTTRPVPGAPGLEYAGALPRVGAYLVDGILLALISFAMAIVVANISVSLIVASLLALVTEAAYFIVSWRSSFRATLGMRAFKLQIGHADGGQTISLQSALLRWFVLIGWTTVVALLPIDSSNLVSLISLSWAIVLLISVTSDEERRGLHDKWAGSAIVRPIGQSDLWALVAVVVIVLIPILAIVFVIGSVRP